MTQFRHRRGPGVPWVALVLAVALVGCGGGDDGADAGDDASGCPTSGRYLDMPVGASFSYRVTDVGDGSITAKVQTIGAVEDVGGAKAGTSANRVTTTKPNGMTISWQEDTGESVVRHREQDQAGSTQTDEVYNPSKLRMDDSAAHTTAGATWSVAYDEVVTIGADPPVTVSKTEDWDVVAVDTPITVPAGTFCTIHVHRISRVGDVVGSEKNYWFTRGIGKIKEEGDSQIEELVQYTR
jgi:hypothetical protein